MQLWLEVSRSHEKKNMLGFVLHGTGSSLPLPRSDLVKSLKPIPENFSKVREISHVESHWEPWGVTRLSSELLAVLCVDRRLA